MPYILSSGTQCAEFAYSQKDVQSHVYDLFPMQEHEKKRLFPIFEHATIDRRQFAAPLDWFQIEHGLEERNNLYHKKALSYSLQAVRTCLREPLIGDSIPIESIDHIIFVSSTGISTPTLDAYLMNELGCKEETRRMPLFGLGCAGGTSGIAKAYEWLIGHPDQNVLVVCVELCSLTFQMNDTSVSNFVGTALFGDGASAVLVAGDRSPLLERKSQPLPAILNAYTKTKKDSTDVMGWRVVDSGFEVIFNKSIPRLVKNFWKDHVQEVTLENGWQVKELPFIVAHPGGRKVIEAYEEVFDLAEDALKLSRQVLREHGNMSSPTVQFVLHEVLKTTHDKGTKSFMTSLGPGFSSEIVSLEWK